MARVHPQHKAKRRSQESQNGQQFYARGLMQESNDDDNASWGAEASYPEFELGMSCQWASVGICVVHVCRFSVQMVPTVVKTSQVQSYQDPNCLFFSQRVCCFLSK